MAQQQNLDMDCGEAERNSRDKLMNAAAEIHVMCSEPIAGSLHLQLSVRRTILYPLSVPDAFEMI